MTHYLYSIQWTNYLYLLDYVHDSLENLSITDKFTTTSGISRSIEMLEPVEFVHRDKKIEVSTAHLLIPLNIDVLLIESIRKVIDPYEVNFKAVIIRWDMSDFWSPKVIQILAGKQFNIYSISMDGDQHNMRTDISK